VTSLCIFLSGCVAYKSTNLAENKRDIVYSVDRFPKELSYIENNCDTELVNAVFEGLVALQGEENIIPALAEDWTISKDKLEYRFTIREEAKWSDGTKIEAEDFVRFFCDVLLNRKSPEFNQELACIYGAEDYYKGKITAKEMGIKADGSKFFVIRLNYPSGTFLKSLTKPAYALRTDIAKLSNWKLNYKKIKYSGAFVIDNIEEKEGITICKNTFYWNEGEVKESKFVLKEKISPEIALAEYEAAKIDIISNPPISEISRIINSENTIVINKEASIGIRFNLEDVSIGYDSSFRKAIAASVEPESIAEQALSEYDMKNIYGFEDTINVFKDNAIENNSNITKAKAYFKEVNEKKKKKISLAALNNDKYKKIANALKSSIDEQLGTNIELKLIDYEEFSKSIEKKDFDMIITNFPINYKKESNPIENAAVYLFKDAEIIAKNSDILELEGNAWGNLDLKKIERKN
jgi:peptide/nickel transport system substrate-binding protein